MQTSKTSPTGRREFLRWLVGLAAGLSLAGVGGCGTKKEAKKIPPTNKLFHQPDKKP